MAVKRLSAMAFCECVFLVTLAAQPLGKGVISGVVRDGETGESVRKAIVTLTLQGTPRRWASTRTDTSGHFIFEDLPAGKYDLRAAKGTEGTAVYGAKSLRELGDVITLGDGEVRGNLVLSLLHPAAISGHVYDSDGDPVVGVTVNLLRQGRNLGVPVLVNYRSGATDDRGEYYISQIDPGTYRLRAAPPRFGGNFAGATNSQGMLVEAYYNNAREEKDAAAVRVRSGENLTGIDFQLVSEPAASVQGQIFGVPRDAPSPENQAAEAGPVGGIEVRISPVKLGEARWSNGSVAPGPDYRFQFSNLIAGRYLVEAIHHSAGRAYGATQVFEFHGGSNDVSLTLSPALDIQGTLRVEGEAPPAARLAVGGGVIGAAGIRSVARGRGNGWQIQLTRPGSLSNLAAEVGADGRFTFREVLPGEWQLAVTPVPPGFLKSAQFGDKDVRFTRFEVGPDSEASLNIVVSMHTATVEGEVDSGTGEAKRAGIVLAPVGAYHNLARFYYGGPADDTGKFKLNGVAPGKYKIFGIEKLAAAAFRNPEAADQLEEFGEVIDVAEGATVETHPKLIPADRAAKVLE
jgi:uncharacterized protein (DUF2141 family)